MGAQAAAALRAIFRDGRSYLAFAALQLGAASTLAAVLSATFGYAAASVLLHAAYVLAFVGLQTLGLGAAARLAMRVSPALAHWLVACALGVSLAALLAINAANWISNLAWQASVDYSLFVRLPAHLAGVAAAVRVPVVVLHLVLAGFVACCCALVYPFASSLTRALCALLSEESAGGLLRTRARLAGTLLWALGLPCYLTFQSVVLFAPGADARWRGEVLSSLLIDQGVQRFRDKPHLLQVSLRDAAVRAEYTAELPDESPNVVLISVDSLRPDRSPLYGYERDTTPFLLQMHEEGRLTRVRFATSACADSLCGILALLSSRSFNQITYKMFKLNDALYKVGYRVHFVLSGDHDWQGIRQLIGPAFDSFSDGYGSGARTINDDRAVLEKLSTRPRWDGQPSFFVIHLMSVHSIGTKLEYDELWSDERRRSSWSALRVDAEGRDQHVQVYDERVLQADGVIEQLFDILQEKGYLERAVVVITSDHGEALGEHGGSGHGMGLYQESLKIPLLIYDFAGTRYANTEFATQVDVGPTLLQRLSLPVPETWQGRSLLTAPAKRYTFHQTPRNPYRFAVIRAEDGQVYKLLAAPDPDEPEYPPEQLFDLVRDPGETRNLVDAEPAVLADLRARLVEYRAVEHLR